jgi:hypothetical protein
MDQHPVMWTDIILRKPKVHLIYKRMALKVATQGEAPQRRPNMESRDTHWNNPQVRKLTTPRNLLVEKIVHISKGEEIIRNIPRAMTLKSSRKPNHPLSMDKLGRGKKQKFECLS